MFPDMKGYNQHRMTFEEFPLTKREQQQKNN